VKVTPFYIRKALDCITSKIRNTTWSKYRMLLVEVFNEKQGEVLLKTKLLGSHFVDTEEAHIPQFILGSCNKGHPRRYVGQGDPNMPFSAIRFQHIQVDWKKGWQTIPSSNHVFNF
jgi:hypothetical protein